MSEPLLLAIDQGTSSSRAILFSKDGRIVATRQKELKLHMPHKGWVEQDPESIWGDVMEVTRGVLAERQGENIAVIGITNQRETTVLWDRATGKPIYNAIVWQDRRTAEHCSSLKEKSYEPLIASKTGLLLDPYFSATKIAWILDHVSGARARAEAGELAFGTVDSFLLWRLTGGKVHATDATNAARTMLYNIHTQEWDRELLDLFGVPVSLLPEVKDNVADFGRTALGVFEKEIPIGGMAGDQQAALIGQACFAPGMVKSTYGTGCFALMNIGGESRLSQNRLLTTIAYRIGGRTTYALEGSIFVAGAAIQWLRDNAGFFSEASASEILALSVPDANDVYFVPAFTGLGAPYWDPAARGAILGLTRETTKAHITRAALEAQAYQTYDLMAAMEKDSGVKPKAIRADGGLVANGFVCQFLADILDTKVEIPVCAETTALGAAYLAGLSAGVYTGFDDLAANWKLDRAYVPNMEEDTRKSLLRGWAQAVKRVM
jgi:glycerol kinase